MSLASLEESVYFLTISDSIQNRITPVEDPLVAISLRWIWFSSGMFNIVHPSPKMPDGNFESWFLFCIIYF